MGLREKLIHYTDGLGDDDLKQEAIATIEQIAQYMDEDELLHHSRPLALAYLALTEDASAPVVHGRWMHLGGDEWCCSACGFVITTEGSWDKPTKKYCEECGAKMEQEARQEDLEEAISHLKELIDNHDFGCPGCKRDHEKLLGFLEELKQRRAKMDGGADNEM